MQSFNTCPRLTPVSLYLPQSVIRQRTVQQTTKYTLSIPRTEHCVPSLLVFAPSISALLASSRRVSQPAAANVHRLGHGLDSSRQTTLDRSFCIGASTPRVFERSIHLDHKLVLALLVSPLKFLCSSPLPSSPMRRRRSQRCSSTTLHELHSYHHKRLPPPAPTSSCDTWC